MLFYSRSNDLCSKYRKRNLSRHVEITLRECISDKKFKRDFNKKLLPIKYCTVQKILKL
jgi:hypothetical protein